MRWIPLLLFVSSSLSAAQGNVLVVDDIGPYYEIQEAVLAAQDGDTILVRPSSPFRYDPVDIVDKALTIAADVGTGVVNVDSVRVRELAAGKTVVLSGLRIATGFIGDTPTLWLQENAGTVHVVGCIVFGRFWTATPALRVESSGGGTAVAACALNGGDGGGGDEVDGFPGAEGLALADSRAALFDCSVTGGEGGPLYIANHAGPGGAGAIVTRQALPTRLHLADVSIQGGPGGELPWCEFGFLSGPGGPGLVLGAGATVQHLETTFAGGPGGSAAPCGESGEPGPALDVSGLLVAHPTTAPQLAMPTLAHEGETITLSIAGVPGDQVVLLAGLGGTFRERPVGVQIVLAGGVALFPLRGPIGTIGPAGFLNVDLALPVLPAGVEAGNLWFQVLARHADGKRALGGFSVVTVVDSAF